MTDELKKEVVILLLDLKTDAEMALSGEWGVAENAPDEMKEGFQCQIDSIDEMLTKLNQQQ